jgi:hypothetical protein
MVKAKAITQAEVDARKAREEQERQVAEAWQTIRERQNVTGRLVLWLMRYVWPRLTTEERAEVRQIIPDEMETEIKTALEKLP